MTRDEQIRRGLREAADPLCPDCGGDGLVCVCWGGGPDKCEDMACDCTVGNRPDFDEPHDPREAD